MTLEIKNTIKRHYVAIVLAVLVGLITIGPNLVFIESLGEKYQGLYIMKSDSQPYYTARIKELYEGNGMANPFIYEHKKELPATPGFAAIPIALLGKVLGMEAETAALISTFILPFVISLLVYCLFFQLTASRLWSVVGAALILCGGVLFNMPDILHLVRLDVFYTQFTIWSRPVLPAMSSLVFFLYLNVLVFALRKNTLRWYAYLGVVFGMSFYVYFYNFTFLLALNGVLVIVFLFSKQKDISLKLFYSSILGVFIGFYSIIHLYKVSKHPLYSFLSESLGLDPSRNFIISSGFLITTVLFAAYLIHKKKLNQTIVLLLTLLLTSFIVVNQQVITGKVLQEGHYHWYFNVPVWSIIIVYILADLLKSNPRIKYVAAGTLIALSIFTSGFIQYSSYNYWQDKVAEDQRYMPVLKWLKDNTGPEEVVMVNSAISELVPIFTENNVVYDVQAYNFFWSKERSQYMPEYILESDTEQRIKKYKVDYAVWDKIKNPEWEMDRYIFLRKEFSENNLEIFTILPH